MRSRNRKRSHQDWIVFDRGREWSLPHKIISIDDRNIYEDDIELGDYLSKFGCFNGFHKID